MRHILFLWTLLAVAGCKTTATPTVMKEKPVADPLFTSKKPVARSPGPPRAEDVPVPHPPPALAEPPRPDAAIRLAGER